MNATIYAQLETSAADLWQRANKNDAHIVALVGSALDLLCVSHWDWADVDVTNAMALILKIDQS